MKRRIAALVLLWLIAGALAGTATPGRAADTPAPTALPTLRVGTSGDYRPFSFHDAEGRPVGFDITIAEQLALYLGRKLELVPFRWPGLTSQLQAGAFDIAMSGVTIGPERALHVAFTRPYAITGAVAVIRAADASTFDAIDKLDRPGVRIVVNAGGHLEQVARQHFRRAQISAITDNSALPTLLLNGGADAAISEELEARTWPTKALVVRGPFTHDDKAYALRPDDADLLRRVNAWLAAQEENGWLNTQRRKWFSGRTALTPQQAGFEALMTVMDLRLRLMPFVAAVKRREHLPVHDPAQEAQVLAHVREAATAEQLNADDVVQLFRAQIEAAKAVEAYATDVNSVSDLEARSDQRERTIEKTPTAGLADVRAAVARVTDAIIAELGRCAPWLREPQRRNQLDGMLRRRIAAAGLTAPAIDVLARAACQVRRKQERIPPGK